MIDTKIEPLWRACESGAFEEAQQLLLSSGEMRMRPDVVHALFFLEFISAESSARLNSAAWRALDNFEALICQWPEECLVYCSPLLNLLVALRRRNDAAILRWRAVAVPEKPRSILVFFRAAAHGRPEFAEQFLREVCNRRLTATVVHPLLRAPLLETCADAGLPNALGIVLALLDKQAVIDDALVARAERRQNAKCAALLSAAPQFVPRAAIEIQ